MADVPDPRPCANGHRWPCTRFYNSASERDRCTCGAAPDPRFRDQLARALHSDGHSLRFGPDGYVFDAAMQVIAAEVEARVQAAAAQRAAEASWQGGATALDGAAAVLESQDAPAELVPGIRFAAQVLRETGQQYAARADALAQPADGATPPPEEGDQ